jgi:hypothetical protein
MTVVADRIKVNLDGNLAGADWLKNGPDSWDIPATTAAELNTYLLTRGSNPVAFKALPVYQGNVGSMPWLAEWGKQFPNP